MVPHIKVHSDKIVDLFGGKDAQGIAWLFLIQIRPEFKGSQYFWLYEHELIHVKQFWKVTLLSALLISSLWIFVFYGMPFYVMIGSYGLTLFTKPLLTIFSDKYRLHSEQEAYANDIRNHARIVSDAVDAIQSDLHRLNLSKSYIKRTVERYL